MVRLSTEILRSSDAIGAQPGGYLLLSDHHAVFGGNGMNSVGTWRRVRAAALLLRGGWRAIRDDQQDCRRYPAPPCKEAHLNSAAGLVKTTQRPWPPWMLYGFRRDRQNASS